MLRYLYLNASAEYLKRTAKGNSFDLPPLSLRLAADTTSLKPILKPIIDDLRKFPERQTDMPCFQLTLNDKFEVLIEPKPALSLYPFANAATGTGKPKVDVTRGMAL